MARRALGLGFARDVLLFLHQCTQPGRGVTDEWVSMHFRDPISPADVLTLYAEGHRSFQSASLEGAYLARAGLSRADLREADLFRANLGAADLREANLQLAWLGGANLARANLQGANLKWASLIGANLSRAKLCRAYLYETMLSGADLSGASLVDATCNGVSFEDVQTTEVRIGSTRFINVRLASLCSSPCRHLDASAIDLRTIVRSRNDPGLTEFLRRTGLAHSLSARLVMLTKNLAAGELRQSTEHVLLVHHRVDAASAVKLHGILDSRGLTSYLKPWVPETLFACRVHLVVLLCSQSALRARGALRGLPGIGSDRKVPRFLVVALDDYVHTATRIPTSAAWSFDKDALHAALRSRVVADFSNARSAESYQCEVDKLVAALRAPSSEAGS